MTVHDTANERIEQEYHNHFMFIYLKMEIKQTNSSKTTRYQTLPRKIRNLTSIIITKEIELINKSSEELNLQVQFSMENSMKHL
jgi:hypothetical protein